jgi:hypothetical protein
MQKKSYWSVNPGPAPQRTLKASTSLPPPPGTPAQRIFWPRSRTVPTPLPICPPTRRRDFPLTLEALQQWDAIILSDIGANTLLLHPDTWLKSRRTANRLTLLHDYVAGGGSLMMIGGYYSFQGLTAARAIAIPRWRKCCRSAAWRGTIALKPRKVAMPK